MHSDLRPVADALTAAGISDSEYAYEYPGIHVLWIGRGLVVLRDLDANERWKPSDGYYLAPFDSPSDIIARGDADAIVRAARAELIIRDRLDEALHVADHAFWGVVADRFPEMITGDLDPGAVGQFAAAQRAVVRSWIDANLPDAVPPPAAPTADDNPRSVKPDDYGYEDEDHGPNCPARHGLDCDCGTAELDAALKRAGCPWERVATEATIELPNGAAITIDRVDGGCGETVEFLVCYDFEEIEATGDPDRAIDVAIDPGRADPPMLLPDPKAEAERNAYLDMIDEGEAQEAADEAEADAEDKARATDRACELLAAILTAGEPNDDDDAETGEPGTGWWIPPLAREDAADLFRFAGVDVPDFLKGDES